MSKKITVEVSDAQHKKMKAKAKKLGLSLAALVRTLAS